MNSPTAFEQLSEAWLEAFKPPQKYLPSEWAARFRYLPPEVSAESGPWRNERTPYLVGIMDAVSEPGIEDITLVKGTQLGGSEACRNALGYWIDNDPGPCLIVLPDEKSAEEVVRERIQPMLKHSSSLARHLSPRREDNKLGVIKLDTMSIYIGWSNSAQSLASRPCRYVLFDECDKYGAFAGEEADPISLGEERTKTYLHRKRRIKVSTPTTREGVIWKAWESSGDRRFFHVPCPHCGVYQRLVWTQCKYPKLPDPDKVKRADAIQTQRLAWYECGECKGRMEDRHKPAMLLKGVWASEGQTVTAEGNLAGDRPQSRRVGFHLNSLYSPWVTFSDMAAKWILAEGDPGATMNFRNSWLAEPDEQVQTKIRPSAVREKIPLSGPSLFVPSWATALFATADTQKDHFYFTIRAWGYQFRSVLVHQGRAETFSELYRVCLESVFKAESGMEVRPSSMLIDSGGNRTDEVYEFAAGDPGRVYPTKGASRPMRNPFQVTKTGMAGVQLHLLDTGFFKDMLVRFILGKLAEGEKAYEQWLPHRDIPEDYCIQMASEHKIRDRKTGALSWELISQGAANHYWDCEVLQVAAAYIANIGVIKPVETKEVAEASERSWGPKTRW